MANSAEAVNDQAVAQQVEDKVEAVPATEKPSEETTNAVEETPSTDAKASETAETEPATEDKEKKDDDKAATAPDNEVVEVEAVSEAAASADAVPSATETKTIGTKRKAEATEDEAGAKKVCLEAEA